MDAVDRKIVGLDLAIGVTNVALAITLVTSVGFATEWWWAGVIVAAGAGLLGAASDRSHSGMRALLVAGTLGVVALVFGWVTGTVPFAATPIVLVGLSVGFGLNRFVFGVVRPVPRERRRRTSA